MPLDLLGNESESCRELDTRIANLIRPQPQQVIIVL